jgi:hypothetical protein
MNDSPLKSSDLMSTQRSEKELTLQSTSSQSNSLTPFIKRKCLVKSSLSSKHSFHGVFDRDESPFWLKGTGRASLGGHGQLDVHMLSSSATSPSFLNDRFAIKQVN